MGRRRSRPGTCRANGHSAACRTACSCTTNSGYLRATRRFWKTPGAWFGSAGVLYILFPWIFPEGQTGMLMIVVKWTFQALMLAGPLAVALVGARAAKEFRIPVPPLLLPREAAWREAFDAVSQALPVPWGLKWRRSMGALTANSARADKPGASYWNPLALDETPGGSAFLIWQPIECPNVRSGFAVFSKKDFTQVLSDDDLQALRQFAEQLAPFTERNPEAPPGHPVQND
jgi:hypothetical protein